MMVFRRRGQTLRPVNRIKHVVDIQGGSTLGVGSFNTVIKAVDAPVLANTAEVVTGSTVNGLFLIVEVYATTAGALANAYMLVFKNPGANLVTPLGNVVGGADEKRYVIHQEMVMLEKAVNGNPRTLFKGVIAIPKGYRRFGPKDILTIEVFSPGVNLDFCIQANYREFR